MVQLQLRDLMIRKESASASPTLAAQYMLQPRISFFGLRSRKLLLEPRPDLFAPCDEISRLIAGEQQVYDLNYLDDQLVLAIKGTLSVVELKVMRLRMLMGQESKARRGELFKKLPVRYALDPTGKVVWHPDRRVSEAIQLVFTKFRELWSVRQDIPMVP